MITYNIVQHFLFSLKCYGFSIVYQLILLGPPDTAVSGNEVLCPYPNYLMFKLLVVVFHTTLVRNVFNMNFVDLFIVFKNTLVEQ